MASARSTSEARSFMFNGRGPIREDLVQHFKDNMNFKGQQFISMGAAKLLIPRALFEEAKQRPRPHLSNIINNPSMMSEIKNHSRLLFAMLFTAGHEYLIWDLSNRGIRDSHLPLAAWSTTLTPEVQQSIPRFCNTTILRKKEHMNISQETVLPFKSRVWTKKNGAFGLIYRVEIAEGHLEGYSGRIVAEKSIRAEHHDDEQIIYREIETLRQRRHPHIVPLLASYTLETLESGCRVKTFHLLFPFADMDLAEWMELPHAPDGFGESSKRRQILFRSIYELVCGLSFLHQEKNDRLTAHHDLKPKNMLVEGDHFTIADFGRSHLRPSELGSETSARRGLGTYEYQPPEYWNDDGSRSKTPHGRSFDLWSLGCIIIEIATLIVYGWKPQKVAEFRERRRNNPAGKKDRPQLAILHPPDESFHNNWNVVKDWLHELRLEDTSNRLKSVLKIVTRMMHPLPGSRLYAWEAELDLVNVLYSDERQLEDWKSRVQPPPKQGIQSGTQTPLHRAARERDWDRFHQLLKLGWQENVRDDRNLTALDIIEQHRDDDLPETLCERLSYWPPRVKPEGGQNQILLESVVRGDTEMVNRLLLEGADPMFVDEHGRASLYKATFHGRSSVVACLLQSKGENLLQQKDKQSLETPLHKAASMGYVGIVKQMLRYSPNLEDRQKDGRTALALAANCRHVEVVATLISAGARLCEAESVNRRPEKLHRPGDRRRLRRKGKGDRSNTLLHVAVLQNSLDILERLLRADDVRDCLELKNASGQTALQYALEINNLKCAEFLASAGASLNTWDNRRENIAHLAVRKDLYQFLKVVLPVFRPRILEMTNRLNETPLDLARRLSKHRFISLLGREESPPLARLSLWSVSNLHCLHNRNEFYNRNESKISQHRLGEACKSGNSLRLQRHDDEHSDPKIRHSNRSSKRVSPNLDGFNSSSTIVNGCSPTPRRSQDLRYARDRKHPTHCTELVLTPASGKRHRDRLVRKRESSPQLRIRAKGARSPSPSWSSAEYTKRDSRTPPTRA